MNNQEYLNYLFAGIQKSMPQQDFANLKDDIAAFKTKYLDLPPDEFRTMVNEKYKELMTQNRLRNLETILLKIDKKLQFFMILTIIGLILGLIGALSVIK